MTKRWHDALGKLLEAEIDAAVSASGMPMYQSKAKVFDEMARDGLCWKVTANAGKYGPFTVKVTGWVLTDRGRILYCQECERFYPEVAEVTA